MSNMGNTGDYDQWIQLDPDLIGVDHGNSNDINIASGYIYRDYSIDTENADIKFLYKGEWVSLIDFIDKVERIEKFIRVFMSVYGKQYVGNLKTFEQVYEDELEWEEKPTTKTEHIKDEDLKIEI